MSRFNVMPRTIDVPEVPDESIFLIAVDSSGNYVANEITRQAISYAEPAAIGRLISQQLAKLDELR